MNTPQQSVQTWGVSWRYKKSSMSARYNVNCPQNSHIHLDTLPLIISGTKNQVSPSRKPFDTTQP
jgi:hypothetical protein